MQHFQRAGQYAGQLKLPEALVPLHCASGLRAWPAEVLQAAQAYASGQETGAADAQLSSTGLADLQMSECTWAHGQQCKDKDWPGTPDTMGEHKQHNNCRLMDEGC